MCVKYQTGKSVLSQGLEFESIHFPEHFFVSFPKKTKLMQLFHLSVSFLQVTLEPLSPLQAIPMEGPKPPLCQGLKIV